MNQPDDLPLAPEPTGIERWAGVLDVGGSSIKYGAASNRGVVCGEGKLVIDNGASAQRLIDDLGSAAASALAAAPDHPDLLAIAFPAPFDYPAGRPLLEHKFAAIHGRQLGDDLRHVLGRRELRVVFCNDAAAAGIGEAAWGSGSPTVRMLMITLGTGLGACLVENDRTVEGGAAGDVPELYRRTTDAGTADDRFSARGLAERLGCSPLELPSVLERPGPRALHELEAFGEDLGRFLSPVIEATGARLLVVGGGVSAAFEVFAPGLRRVVPVESRAAMLGPRAALLGAAQHGFRSSAAPSARIRPRRTQ